MRKLVMSNPEKEQLMAKPGISEVAAICTFAGLGVYLDYGTHSLVLSFLSGVLLGVFFLFVAGVVVSLINFLLLPRKRRAPLAECVAAPLTTLFAFLILGSCLNSSRR